MIVKKLNRLRGPVLLLGCMAVMWSFASPRGSVIGRVTADRLSPQRGLSVSGNVQDQVQKRNPASWGGNHVGKPVPDYVHGDECLFCHRNDIGPGWQRNSHGVTIRQHEDAPAMSDLLKSQPALAGVAGQVEYFLGSRNHVRFLKKQGYGTFAMLNTQAVLAPDGHAQKW